MKSLPILLLLTSCYRPPAPLNPRPSTSPTPSPTDSAPAPSGPVSCEAAVQATLAGHPEARVARAMVLLDAAREDVAGAWDNPELRGRYGTPEPEDRARLGVRVNLPIPGRLEALRSAARAQRAESEAERVEVDVELAAHARRLHVDVRREREQVAWREKQVQLETVARGLADRRVRAGIASGVVLKTAELSLLDARDDLIEARADLRAAEEALSSWAGVTAGDDGCAGAEETAADHPALMAARARRERAHGRAEADAREDWLWPNFAEVTWDPRTANPDRILFELGIDLPVFGGDGAPDPETVMSVADARLDATRSELERAQRAARLAVEAAAARLEALGEVKSPSLAEPPATLEQLELWRLQHRLAGRSIRVRYGLENAQVELRRALGLP